MATPPLRSKATSLSDNGLSAVDQTCLDLKYGRGGETLDLKDANLGDNELRRLVVAFFVARCTVSGGGISTTPTAAPAAPVPDEPSSAKAASDVSMGPALASSSKKGESETTVPSTGASSQAPAAAMTSSESIAVGEVRLPSTLRNTPSVLRHLILSNNNIGDRGIRHFKKAVRCFYSSHYGSPDVLQAIKLESVDFSHNKGIGRRGIQDLAAIVPLIPTLRIVKLDGVPAAAEAASSETSASSSGTPLTPFQLLRYLLAQREPTPAQAPETAVSDEAAEEVRGSREARHADAEDAPLGTLPEVAETQSQREGEDSLPMEIESQHPTVSTGASAAGSSVETQQGSPLRPSEETQNVAEPSESTGSGGRDTSVTSSSPRTMAAAYMMRSNVTLTKINLSYQGLTDNDVRDLLLFGTSTSGNTASCLTHLLLHENSLTSQGANYVAKWLRSDGDASAVSPSERNPASSSARLQVLNLDGNSIASEGVRYICEALKASVSNKLKSLFLARNGIEADGGLHIGQLITKQRSHENDTGLVEISLIGNNLNDRSIFHIARSLSQPGTPSKLRRLHLANNRLIKDYHGLVALAKGALSGANNLKYISLWNCGITNQFRDRLGQMGGAGGPSIVFDFQDLRDSQSQVEGGEKKVAHTGEKTESG